MSNPLLECTGLPRFGDIRPEHVVEAVTTILDDNRTALSALLAEPGPRTWENLIVPLEEMDDRLSRCWSPVRHLHSVADTEALRKAYNTCLELITDYSTDVMQNHDLYQAYSALAEPAVYDQLTPVQRKVIDNALREFRLSGVDLPAGPKAEYKRIAQALSSAQSKFEENVLDATHGWRWHTTDESRLAGLPASARDLAASNARERELDGWVFTLDFPSYYPVMQYADDRGLREEMYTAYVTRASDQGPGEHQWDNSALMEQILTLRNEKAKLLGFASYADYSLERKMAESPQQVLDFLQQLARHSRAAARVESDDVQAYATKEHGISTLQPWDVAYYSEKLRQHTYDFSEEELKPYFPVPQVLSGMFTIVNRLYGIRISEDSSVETWHPDVRFYRIHDAAGEERGGFYLDLYARTHKRGGAWMDECQIRKDFGHGLQRPIAYLSCNFTPPVNGKPSLLTHDEVTTLFHEFGHGLHHMLTRVDYPPVSGINGVAWDAVELPSQFMENWCWERESLDIIGRHVDTGAPIPDELFRKILRAKNFQSAMQMMRQLEFALFDFRQHMATEPLDSAAIQALLDEVRRDTAVLMPPAWNRFQHGFTHIYSGGYAAGYYSYKWAEVLSADAFSKFEEKGIFDRETGELFLHTILEQGGSRDPMELFVEFRGRPPQIDALLRHSGITPEGAVSTT